MYVVEAAKSGILRNVYVNDAATVQAGMLLGHFDDLEEQHAVSQIDVLKGISRSLRDRLSAKRAQGFWDVFATRQQNAMDILTFREQIVVEREDQYKVGEAFKNDVTFARTALLSAEYDLKLLHLEKKMYTVQVEASRDALTRLEDTVNRQEAIIRNRMEDLRVTAPYNGVITWYAFEGGYIERGSPLAKIEA